MRSAQKKHAIIFVHGIGEQEPGDELRNFTNGLYDYMHVKVERLKGMDGHSYLSLDVAPDKQTAYIRYNDGTTAEEFLVTEAWWAKSFRPYGLWRVVRWLLGLISSRFTNDRRKWNPLEYIYSPLIVVLALAGAILFALGIAIQMAPVSRSLINWALVGLQKRAVGFLLGSVGDVQIFAADLFYADVIRSKFEKKLDAVNENKDIDDIVVVAHSQGSLIAYEALSRSYRSPLKKELVLFTVGSPLDKVAWFLKRHHRYRFASLLPDQVKKWVNIYTKFDPVADKLRKYNHHPLPPSNRLVTNQEWFIGYFLDHSAYWANYEVMDLILEQVATSPDLRRPTRRPKSEWVARRTANLRG